MNKIIIVLLFFNFSIGYGQSNFLLGNGLNSSVDMGRSYVGPYLNKEFNNSLETKVEGSPYLFDRWDNISVIMTHEDKKYKIVNLNYDTKSDLFVAKISKDSVFMFKPTYLKEVAINNRIFRKYLNQKTGLYNYYEVIAAHKDTEILKRNQKVIRIGVTNHLTMEKENDYFILRENYFLSKGGKLTDLSIKKKNILKLFGDKSQMVNKFILNNKLSIKEDANLRKVFNYYESLM